VKFKLRSMVEIYVLWSRIEEAKRALANICHHMNCGSGLILGTDTAAKEPQSCFQGDEAQGPCLRIFQWRRIRKLQKDAEKLTDRMLAAHRKAQERRA
jgi:hypothetical protein